MLVAASLATAFTLPARLPPLASSARYAAVHMLDNDGNKSGRYNFEDPRQILNNFFNPSGKVPKVFKTGGKSVKDTGYKATIAGSVSLAHHVRTVAPMYDVPVVIHSDHCAKKLLPWFE